ncbi:hypothetical protein TanjilG_28785 [Lupinus angustifolius]|uniref:Uncharacterized protein n=1 Tax=Lupinus angustifolius TaxID=3871 RepID=A0A4P1R8X6_LUPAN|nr:PREDICTED: uncharacterized protein LOC109356027 [Lupinus angustifolius]OIW05320.1 hypothetical protein TanjilG_28785 [Lupinus angustifolius]
MASACINNFLDCPPPPYNWLTPRISITPNTNDQDSASKLNDSNHNLDLESDNFKFCLEDRVTMLPADELFSDGKLIPLHLSLKNSLTNNTTSPETVKSHRRPEISTSDQYLFSPKAPRCSSRWKEILGLKKLYQSASMNKTTSLISSSSSSSNNKSLKYFLHRKTTSLTPENAPLLKDHSDSESISISSSRLSLCSSSSSHDHDGNVPRLSLDSEKQNPNPNLISIHRNPNHSRIRLVKAKPESFENNRKIMNKEPYSGTNRVGFRKPSPESGAVVCRGVTVDSPRMNSSGKIVFQSLERSSSSPSSFNGGPRFKYRDRGMERSYSANVRVTPVLNVPVSSLMSGSKSGSIFGFGQLFSSQPKKEVGVGNGGPIKGHQYGARNRCERS